MSNIILVKHGAAGEDGKIPVGALQPYELGYCDSDKCLYIGTENGPQPIFIFLDQNNDGNIAWGSIQIIEPEAE